MDFIVPLKQVGIITRSVLEAIREFYQPRRIIVVTKSIEGDILSKLLPYWNVGPVECLDESVFFVKNFGLSFEDIIKEYDATRQGATLYNPLPIPLQLLPPLTFSLNGPAVPLIVGLHPQFFASHGEYDWEHSERRLPT